MTIVITLNSFLDDDLDVYQLHSCFHPGDLQLQPSFVR